MWAVADYSNHYVYIFDGEDQLVRKFGSNGSGSGQFDYPEGVAFDNDNHLYVADCGNHRIQKFTIDGVYLLQFGSEDSGNGKLKDLQYTMAKYTLVTVTIIVFQYFKLMVYLSTQLDQDNWPVPLM